ncbi:hypothetical protein [Xanthomonas campestris]|uniref:hypothetical protein n=1 Tax=Xanthomonas campestris TaxID=339 RepID=UPI000C1DDD08|nr:hypothetical protein [Xanthomonas campestris]MEA0763273.1 hypothetical protein [Xanthomonas campestris pv. campestris]MEA9728353.1 hypothetical protein [Xanthomonas campestris pv. raphani]MEB1225110.1 hypothetical protein [Xanthomonas campestris pv. campestris]MEB1245777.1 hypothetical protein [Xanthomonas campestris pv. campestris]MEB1254046.1 hypothetical protein [Xanthomonas campestris pv. campestris]
MANYINKEILAEAYTHLDIELFDDKVRLNQLRSELTAFFKERASFLFETDVDIVVEFEEGSLKTRVIALGSAAAVIAGTVGAYPSFKEGVTQIANDAVAIAHSANIEVIFRTRTPYCDRLRVEKRKGVFGRVQALLIELDGIATDIETSKLPTGRKSIETTEALNDRLIGWDERADILFSKFEDQATEACIAEGLLEEVANLPADFPWQKELVASSLKSQIVESDTRTVSQIAGLSSRYSSVLKSIKKKLERRVKQAGEG